MRKLIISGFVLLIPQRFRLIRLLIAILLSIAHSVLLQAARPHKQPSTHIVAVATSVMLVFTLLTALLIVMYNELPPDLIQDFFGFDRVMPLVGIILGFNFGVVVVTAVVLSMEARYTLRDTLRRQVGGRRCFMPGPLPVLSLADSKATHVFLSHSWPDQKIAATIKQRLEMLLPGVQVFAA